MKLLLLAILFLIPNLALTDANKNPQPDWNPSDEVPVIQIIGEHSPEEAELTVKLRQSLIGELQYWKERGLPNPPDLREILYITNYGDVHLVEFMKFFNPELPDFLAHVKAQHDRLKFSQVGRLINAFEKRNNLPADSYIEYIFDQYAMVRYGFSVPNFYESLSRNIVMTEVDNAVLLAPKYDNAFYGQSINIDLTELIKADFSESTIANPFSPQVLKKLMEAINLDVLNSLQARETFKRMVILPRTTQRPNDMGVTTIADVSVSGHEMGHHINNTLDGISGINNILNEALSDYLIASYLNDPKIGAFFAGQASAEIARRLREQGNPMDEPFARRLEKMAQKGVLRDLRDLVHIDNLERDWFVADFYRAGDPLRMFLWQLHETEGVDKHRLDNVVIESIKQVSALPALISDATTTWIQFREVMSKIYVYIQTYVKLKKLEHQHPELKGSPQLAMEAQRQGLAKVLKKQEKRMARRLWLRKYGLGQRPAIEADYVLSEFIRTVYRVSQELAPELTPLVRSKGEMAMNASSNVIATTRASELVFLRTRLDRLNPVASVRLNTLLKRISANRSLISRELDNPNPDQTKLKALGQMYDRDLAKFQEYQRSGWTYKLFSSHPVLKPIVATLKYVGSKLAPGVESKSVMSGLDLLLSKPTVAEAASIIDCEERLKF